jgi:hypothetical protein
MPLQKLHSLCTWKNEESRKLLSISREACEQFKLTAQVNRAVRAAVIRSLVQVPVSEPQGLHTIKRRSSKSSEMRGIEGR